LRENIAAKYKPKAQRHNQQNGTAHGKVKAAKAFTCCCPFMVEINAHERLLAASQPLRQIT
jgi:hypothetical protein